MRIVVFDWHPICTCVGKLMSYWIDLLASTSIFVFYADPEAKIKGGPPRAWHIACVWVGASCWYIGIISPLQAHCAWALLGDAHKRWKSLCEVTVSKHRQWPTPVEAEGCSKEHCAIVRERTNCLNIVYSRCHHVNTFCVFSVILFGVVECGDDYNGVNRHSILFNVLEVDCYEICCSVIIDALLLTSLHDQLRHWGIVSSFSLHLNCFFFFNS